MTSDRTVLRLLLVIVAVVVLLPVLTMAFMMPMMGMWGWGHMDAGTWGGTWMWLLMWLVPLAVVAGIGYLLYSVVRGTTPAVSDRALEELRMTYARGDLTDEEFEQRRERLQREE